MTLPNSDGLDKGDFYFINIYIFKNWEKIWVNQFFLICFKNIKNNSYINLGAENRIRIVWSCSSNAVETHNVNIFHKNFGNWKASCQNFNKI